MGEFTEKLMRGELGIGHAVNAIEELEARIARLNQDMTEALAYGDRVTQRAATAEAKLSETLRDAGEGWSTARAAESRLAEANIAWLTVVVNAVEDLEQGGLSGLDAALARLQTAIVNGPALAAPSTQEEPCTCGNPILRWVHNKPPTPCGEPT